MPNGWKRLADYARSELGRRNWTQRDLAREAGVSERTISDILSGRPRPWMPRRMPQIEASLGWEPGTARRIIEEGYAPPGVEDAPADLDDRLLIYAIRMAETDAEGLAIYYKMRPEARRDEDGALDLDEEAG